MDTPAWIMYLCDGDLRHRRGFTNFGMETTLEDMIGYFNAFNLQNREKPPGTAAIHKK